jgi:hypothetical protein
VATVQFSRAAERALGRLVDTRADRRAPVSQNSTACTASSSALCHASERTRPSAYARRQLGRPGSVDVLAARSMAAAPPAARRLRVRVGAVAHVSL